MYTLCILLIISLLIALWIYFQGHYVLSYIGSNKNHVPNAKRIAIVTAIFGDYDNLKEHAIKNRDMVDWYCFTDNKQLTSSQWQIINTTYHLSDKSNYKNSYVNLHQPAEYNMMCAKYYKMQNHHIDALDKYDYIIWVDGSIILRENFVNQIMSEVIHPGRELVNFNHSVRNNIKDELAVSITMQKYKSQNLDSQYLHYIANGFPDSIGLFENTIIIRKKNDKTNKLFDLWWLHNQMYSYQDQISYPYVLWKSGCIPDYIINENVFNNTMYSYVDFNLMKKH